MARKEKEEQEQAALKIQAIQRGKLARKEKKEQEQAALKIQAIQRGKMVRKDMSTNSSRTNEPKLVRPEANNSQNSKTSKKNKSNNTQVLSSCQKRYLRPCVSFMKCKVMRKTF